MRSTIDFLRDDARIPRVEVCPYELPLVVLARFFSLHKEPSQRTRMLLKRWLWRGSLAERLSGASGSMQQHVDDIGDDEDGSVQALLHRTGSPTDVALDDWSRTASARVATARGKMLVCALLARHPRDLQTGDRLDVREIFRDNKACLRAIVRESAAGRGIANKLLHPATPTGARQLILECSDEAALVSHGIHDDARGALRAGEAKKFYALRSEVLRRSTVAFFEQQAEIVRDDTPSLAALTRRSA